MPFKHKHDAIIRAYLDDKTIQWKYPGEDTWRGSTKLSRHYPVMMEFSPTMEFRIAPESRWLNVYVAGTIDDFVAPNWHPSRECADRFGRGNYKRVAVIEDKQDGSPWILHQLEK